MNSSLETIKVHCDNPEGLRAKLYEQHFTFRGKEIFEDSYYHTPRGKLALRTGNNMHDLLLYEEGSQGNDCLIQRIPLTSKPEIKDALNRSLGTYLVVNVEREFYGTSDARVRIDRVREVGAFAEVEFNGPDNTQTKRVHCLTTLGLSTAAVVTQSYAWLFQHRK